MENMRNKNQGGFKMRFLLLPLLLTYMASANTDIYPKEKECQLFNNLKHTKNIGHVILKLDRSYKMYVHHKGQYLVKVEGAIPPQRWVDDDCLSFKPLRGTPIYEDMHSTTVKPTVRKTRKKSTATSKQNLLALSWHNAFCETHRYKKECKRDIGSKSREREFVLHGLWPQPRNRIYCDIDYVFRQADESKRWRDIPHLTLDAEVATELAKIMPGYVSDLHKHEWIKHGTCYSTEANEYFKDAISLTKQVNSALGVLFTQKIGKYLSLKEVRTLADKTFGHGAGKRVILKCKHGLITELWLQLGTGSGDLATLLKRGEPMHSRCKGGRVDKAGYSS